MKTTLTFILCCISVLCNGQQREIEILSKREDSNNVTFYIDHLISHTYSVIIYFTSLENCVAPSWQYFSINNAGKIMTLFATDKDKGIYYKYKYFYADGDINAKHEPNIIYRLPYSNGVNRKSSPLTYINVGKDEKPNDYYSIYFQMEKGDTVFAARKGVVVKIVDDIKPMDNIGYVSYKSERNAITIEHKDGTTADYSVLESNSIMVKEGDTVYPNTPIALAGSYNNIDYQLRLIISHLALNKDYQLYKSENKFIIKYIKPVFKATEQTDTLYLGKRYTAIVTPEIIQQEMTKKEIKKLQENKK